MLICYLDESGDPYSWQTQKNFVVGAVAVHEGQIYGLTQALNEIQATFFPHIRIPIAFHASKIKGGKKPFRELSEEKREKLLHAVYDLINKTGFPNIVLFASAVHITAVTSESQALREAFENICVPFNVFLMRQYKSGYKDKGILIIDRAHEKDYRESLEAFQNVGTSEGYYVGNIVDIPYFSGITHTRMLQLADFCAYAVFRYYENGDSEYFDKIYPRFDRRKKGHEPPDGLKHIIKTPCQCKVCSYLTPN